MILEFWSNSDRNSKIIARSLARSVYYPVG